MNNKKNILEDLNRIHLLMKYDSSKTLNENIDDLPIMEVVTQSNISEASIPSPGLKNMFTALFGVLDNQADDVVRLLKLTPADEAASRAELSQLKNRTNPTSAQRNRIAQLEDELNKLNKIRTGGKKLDDILSKYQGKIELYNGTKLSKMDKDAIIKAMAEGTIKPKSRMALRYAMLKSSQISNTSKNRLIDHILSKEENLDELAALVRDKNTIYNDIKSHYLALGHSEPVAIRFATEAEKKFMAALDRFEPKFKGGTTGGGGGGGGTPPMPNPNIPTPPWYKRIPWKKIGYGVAGVGSLYLLWKWFTGGSSDEIPFPDCIKNKSTPSDLKITQDNAFNFVHISNTGVPEIDDKGGADFYQDGKIVVGGAEGKWIQQTAYAERGSSTTVQIEINGMYYRMFCESSGGGGGDRDGEKDGGGYRNCTTFPFVRGCKSSIIIEIQRCLGIRDDGMFGPETESALVSNGYSKTIDEDTYRKIKEKCEGGGYVEPTKPEKTDMGYGDVVTPEDIFK